MSAATNRQRMFQSSEPETKSFETNTPIAAVTIPERDHCKAQTFHTFEELEWFLKCQNPVGLKFAAKHLAGLYTIDGLGVGAIVRAA